MFIKKYYIHLNDVNMQITDQNFIILVKANVRMQDCVKIVAR